MKLDENKMVLSASAAKSLDKALDSAVDEMMPRANVIGVGAGVKWKSGEPTGEPAIMVLVTHKLPKDALPKRDLVPAKYQETQTDVIEIGYPFAMPGNGEPSEPPPRENLVVACQGAFALTARQRPARGGYSVGHKNITAGTIATCVYKILPGGSTNPPAHGIGVPPKFYILSNNHVLANSNAGTPGDAILQPGPFDGGVDPADRIATLSEYIPITFAPAVPLANHNNLVDAAIAEGNFQDLNREIYWSGRARGWRQKAAVTVGTLVKKTGRTTNFTTGRITAVNATVDVGYGGGRTARFRDQIILSAMSSPGDSGSLITTLDDVAVGLLYAGSSVATIANQIENVRSLLRIEVAEQIL
ncbi:MAG: S1 family peptidase [Acidobacteria bacterium]|nr:S1 family peptidase [Acidobacteriota bacterium]